LGTLVKRFKNPLLSVSRSGDPFITDKEVKDIFSIVEVIYGYNLMLLEALNKKMGKWSSRQTLGDVFLVMVIKSSHLFFPLTLLRLIF